MGSSASHWETVGEIASRSEPGKLHFIKRHRNTGRLSCDCMGFRFNKACPHMRAFTASDETPVTAVRLRMNPPATVPVPAPWVPQAVMRVEAAMETSSKVLAAINAALTRTLGRSQMRVAEAVFAEVRPFLATAPLAVPETTTVPASSLTSTRVRRIVID